MTSTAKDRLRKRLQGISDEDRRRLVETHITPHLHKAGLSEVVLRGRQVPVWAIIGHLMSMPGDIDQVAEDYDVPDEAVVAALLFYADNKVIIDERLRANRGDTVQENDIVQGRPVKYSTIDSISGIAGKLPKPMTWKEVMQVVHDEQAEQYREENC